MPNKMENNTHLQKGSWGGVKKLRNLTLKCLFREKDTEIITYEKLEILKTLRAEEGLKCVCVCAVFIRKT